jgi:tetratricopeptide (TPR) repeat protein
MAKDRTGKSRLRCALKWAIIAVLALVVLAVSAVLYLGRYTQPPEHNAKPAEFVVPRPTAQTNQIKDLADLSLPPYPASPLRNPIANSEFAMGMKAYARGDCAAAIPHLLRVPAGQDDQVTARFYAGVCQLAAHDLAAANKNLFRVTGDIDSPQYEAAHYYLAQLLLAGGDAAGARRYLQRCVDMDSEYARRARTQLDKLQGLH